MVTDHSYQLRVLAQAPGDPDGYAVTITLPSQSLEAHVERQAVSVDLWYADPDYLASLPDAPTLVGEPTRRLHTVVTRVNDFGQVEQSVSIAYGRTDPGAHPDQRTNFVAVSAATFGNDDGDPSRRLLGVPLEQRSFEVLGLPTDLTDLVDPAEATGWAAAPLVSNDATAALSVSRRPLTISRHRYWDDLITSELPDGSFGRRAIGRRVLAAALTQTQAQSFGSELDASSLAATGHYEQFVEGESACWISSTIVQPDPGSFYQPVAFVDPFGLGTFVRYDTHSLVAVDVLVTMAAGASTFQPDPAGPNWNRVSATYDYRVLAPAAVTDPHGSTHEARFDALGAVVAQRFRGAHGEGAPAGEWDQTFSYDLHSFVSGSPNSAQSLQRETYDAASRWQRSVRYFTATGGALLSKVQAEGGMAPHYDTAGHLVLGPGGAAELVDTQPIRWIGNGRCVYDGKSRPIAQYDPYFAPDDRYEDESVLVATGHPAYLRHDPIGRVVRTDFPDGSFERVTPGVWSSSSWDRADTVLESAWYAQHSAAQASVDQRRSAAASAGHANTPSRSYSDALGRVIELVETIGAPGQTRELTTTISYDIGGHVLSVTDPRGVRAMEATYDLIGRPLTGFSSDAGAHRVALDALGRPLLSWSGRRPDLSYEVRVRAVRDKLGRDTQSWVLDQTSAAETCRLVMGYADDDPTYAISRYLLGVAHQVFDGAGLSTTMSCDFRGTPVHTERRFLSAVDTEPDWGTVAAAAPSSDRSGTTGTALEPAGFATAVTLDALTRPTTTTAPDGTVTELAYNPANLIAAIRTVRPGEPAATVLDHAVYDVKRRRALVAFGPNGSVAQVVRSYDDVTHRLVRLTTTRPGSGSNPLQDLQFVYDVVGNILTIRDDAQPRNFFKNTVVDAARDYTYDDLYQLLTGSGREAVGVGHTSADSNKVPQLNDLPPASDLHAVVRYLETYTYDDSGNLLTLRHLQQVNGGAAWLRTNVPDSASNQLASSMVSGAVATADVIEYDLRGNMTTLGPRVFSWNWMGKARRVVISGNVIAHYHYDRSGARVRKVVMTGARVEDRRYVGTFESFAATVGGTVTDRVTTQHLQAASQVSALLENATMESGQAVTRSVTRYQLGDQLDSTTIELDVAGNLLTYEEFHPYGTTAYRSQSSSAVVSQKRYRFTAMERDDETGLQLHGARYYAPWLGRWTSADPAGLVDGANCHAYAHSQPVIIRDVSGNTGIGSAELEQMRSARIIHPHQFAVDLQQHEEYYYAGLSRFGYKGSWISPDDYLKDFDSAFAESESVQARSRDSTSRAVVLAELQNGTGYIGTAASFEAERQAVAWRIQNERLANVGSENPGAAIGFAVGDAFGNADRGALIGSVIFTVAAVVAPWRAKSRGSGSQTNESAPATKSRSIPMTERSSVVYELRWKNTSSGESGTYKYGESVQGLNRAGVPKRAQSQLLAWNKELPAFGYRMELGEVWGMGHNGMNMLRPSGRWVEQYLVTSHSILKGSAPVGNQLPLPWSGAQLPPPPHH
ncbi:RHS repeat-associated protein [Nakamurella sp. UYEF19]